MLERLGRPGSETISQPDPDVIGWVTEQVRRGKEPKFAEIGVGIGATTVEVCRILSNRGEVHIFDYESKVIELKADLEALGFRNIVAHGNRRLHWDSYVWSLLKVMDANGCEFFDYVYLDGAHTVFHDLSAYLVAKRLLKVGGFLDLDDYYWSWAISPTMNPDKCPWIRDFMTPEQLQVSHVQIIVESFIEQDVEFEVVVARKVFRKVCNVAYRECALKADGPRPESVLDQPDGICSGDGEESCPEAPGRAA